MGGVPGSTGTPPIFQKRSQKTKRRRANKPEVMSLTLSSEQPQMHLLNMLYLGWVAKQLKWKDMEQVKH